MIDQEKLDAIFDRHEMWLRGRPEGEQAILTWMDLSNAIIRGRNLSRAVFCCSNLRSAKFIDCWCISALFRNACLSGVDIVNCNFALADLCNARFGGGALIAESDFEFSLARNADLRNTCIYRCALFGVNLAGAKVDSNLIFQRPTTPNGGAA